MNILITGASGFIGKALTRELQRQHHVIACVFNNSQGFENEVRVNFAKLTHADDWLPLLDSVDVVINCVGIIKESKTQTFDLLHSKAPIALFQACELAGVKKVIQISALGADEQAESSYHLSKKKADDGLRSSKLNGYILRPSLVYANGGASHEQFKFLSNLPIIPLPGKGDQKIQPVSLMRLMEVIQACLQYSHSGVVTVDVVGDKIFTYKQWLQQLRSKRGHAWFVPVPMSVMMGLARVAALFGHSLLRPENLKMLQRSTLGDPEKLQKFLKGESI